MSKYLDTFYLHRPSGLLRECNNMSILDTFNIKAYDDLTSN
jgi:hypothetical protein